MEITKDKVTELFCIIDDFYYAVDVELAGNLLLCAGGVLFVFHFIIYDSAN